MSFRAGGLFASSGSAAPAQPATPPPLNPAPAPVAAAPPAPAPSPAPAVPPVDLALYEAVRQLRQKLVERITGDPSGLPLKNDEPTRQAVEQQITATAEQIANLDAAGREMLVKETMADLFGFGPIHGLLDDASVSEVMVNGPNKIYVERKGKSVKTHIKFDDDAHVRRIIDRIVIPLGRRVDGDNPLVDARLPDGSRVNAVIEPVAIDGPSITIRKFAKTALTASDLVEFGSMTQSLADFFKACVISRLNIIVSGGTGSGKTTLLNVLSGFIPDDERIVTIEDAAELKLAQEHVVRLETKKPNKDGSGGVTIRDLVKNSLRMRPERIVVGECRGGETLDMLQAMNTGHDGSLTTLHANTPRDAISRIETMALMGGIDFPIKVIREQMSSAVQLIVQQARMRDGSRRITHVTEMAGMEGDKVILQEIFRFQEDGLDANGKVMGNLRASGLRPMFCTKLEAHGFKMPQDMFMVVGAPTPPRR
ncbi:MAG: CpaF family protein [Phycisphaerae bacterium]|nr:CpaF family protein [Phycisphaerae bacterium]